MSGIIETADLPITVAGLREYAERMRTSVGAPNSNNMFELAYQWQDKPHRHVHDLCRRIDLVADEIERLISTLGDALEAMDERRAYCAEWEYKYKQRWDEEDKKVHDALEESK